MPRSPSYLLLLLLGLQYIGCGGNGAHALGPLLHAAQPLLQLEALGLKPANRNLALIRLTPK